MNYYNENDPKAAAWLRELIVCGHIAPGDVDERSIVDVDAADLAGYTQCHFFAGIGGWSYALRLAGWRDDRPVWTGSCPCQPFSVAGKGKGVDDHRHLWPEFARLIGECRPARVFGEQVASKAGREWLAGVRADLEAMGYGVGAADLCAAGVGAPHIRQRLYWVGRLVFPVSEGLEGHAWHGDYGREPQRLDSEACRSAASAGAWSDFDILACTDGKARRVESGTFPLVAGLPKGMGRVRDPRAPFHDSEARIMRLRGYGNAITIGVAVTFIRAYEESVQEQENADRAHGRASFPDAAGARPQAGAI